MTVLEQAKALRWTRRHVLDTDDWTRDEIEAVLETSGAMVEILKRPVRKAPPLRGKTVILFFAEASTRTRVSFELAAKALSADVTTISASGSSVEKGETLLDTVRTLHALGGDVVVMRHASSGAPYFVAERSDAAVINAGDGWHAHPTQGLLDAYTLRGALGHLAKKRIVIVGDVVHSRVARSDINALVPLGATITLSGPPTLMPSAWRCGQARARTTSGRSRTAWRYAWRCSISSLARRRWRRADGATGARGEGVPRHARLHRPSRAPSGAGLRGVGDDRVGRARRAARRIHHDLRDAEHRARDRYARPCRGGHRPRESRSRRAGAADRDHHARTCRPRARRPDRAVRRRRNRVL